MAPVPAARIPAASMVLIGLLACAGPMEVRLPMASGPHAPSLLRLEGPPEVLADVERCAGCHPEAAEGWAASAHAHASFDNPWYRSSVEALRDEVGCEASRHCAGCHDPVLLVTGKLDVDVDPREPEAQIGVPCLACHGVVAATPDGNASLTLDLSALPYPSANHPEADGVAAHRARMQPPELATGAVCGSCHRGFLDLQTGNRTFLQGLDDLGAHTASASRGSRARRLEPSPVPETRCTDCHFADHRFPGGQTALAAVAGDPEAVREMLRGAVTLYAVARPQGADLVVDLVVHNTGTGHAFPGGLGDAQDTWLFLEVRQGDEVVAAVTSASAPAAHRLRAEVLDEAGQPERAHRPHRFAVIAWDHRVQAGDARVFRTLVAGGAAASQVRAEVRHRPHPEALQRAACAATQIGTLPGCGEVPEVAIAEVVADVGPPVTFETAWAYGLGLLHARSEDRDAARAPLTRARALAPTERARAAVDVLMARLEGQQQRTTAALAAADRARATLGQGHPAITRARADALATAWRWSEAVRVYAELAKEAPDDVATWRDLAVAELAVGNAKAALVATAEGLSRSPRHPDLLRVQAGALAELGDPRADMAERAWAVHRRRDDAAARRMACDTAVAGCADARHPIPRHELTPR